MKIKVTHEDLKNFSLELDRKCDKLENYFKEYRACIDDLGNYWGGYPYENYHKKANSYIDNSRNICASLIEFSNFIKGANEGYFKNDEKFKNDIVKEANGFGEHEQRRQN